MNIKEILETWLKDHGYDGLVSDCEECACKIGDLAPCDCSFLDCKPGYEIPCACGGGCLFHMTSIRPDVQRTCPKCGGLIVEGIPSHCPRCMYAIQEQEGL